jgi:hypothetical protein
VSDYIYAKLYRVAEAMFVLIHRLESFASRLENR